jgi:hypothetical protein
VGFKKRHPFPTLTLRRKKKTPCFGKCGRISTGVVAAKYIIVFTPDVFGSKQWSPAFLTTLDGDPLQKPLILLVIEKNAPR